MSSETKHTPGPWCLDITRDGDGDVVRVVQEESTAHPYHIAEVYGHGGDAVTDTQRMRDARLIAAAPEMLEALETIEKWLYHIERGSPMAANAAEMIRGKARAALRKARGEGE